MRRPEAVVTGWWQDPLAVQGWVTGGVLGCAFGYTWGLLLGTLTARPRTRKLRRQSLRKHAETARNTWKHLVPWH